MTISQAFQEYLIDHQIRGNSPHTIRHYRGAIMPLICYLMDKSVSLICLSDLKMYYLHLTERKLSSTTVQTYIRAIRAFMTWCYREEYIDLNLSEKFRLPKAKRRTIDVLTDNEISMLMDGFNLKKTVDLRNYCICILMLDSGLRMNEVVTLRIASLHIAEGYIIASGKGDKERIVPIGLYTKKCLIKYLARRSGGAGGTPLFEKCTFIPISCTTVKQLFRKLKITTNIPRLKPHLLRHTFATRYLENGGDIYSLQLILGHTTLEMVKRYVHITHVKTVGNFAKYSPMDNLMKR